jgi:D-beta-D-heptose 7-phosphate kinase/D-beta-D-heptose 1-phosphate adenosyltransferase
VVDLANSGRHKVKKVVVIGDVIADVYRECTFKKMCPDADDVKAIVEHSRDVRPGGAANVAVNLAALAPDAFIYLIGEMDVQLARLIKQSSKSRVSMEYCAFTDDVMTKERIILDGEFVLRVDNKLRTNSFAAESIWHGLKECLAVVDPDLILMSDYDGGAINQDTLDVLLGYRDRLLVDTKMTDLSQFGSDGQRTRLIKLNREEWNNVVSREAVPERFFDAMVTTLGGDGSELILHRGTATRSQTHTIKIMSHLVGTIDVCGCGDTFLAGLAASLLHVDDDFTAVQFANAAAATVVTQTRTAIANRERTLELLGREKEE